MSEQRVRITIQQHGTPLFSGVTNARFEDTINYLEIPAGTLHGHSEKFTVIIEPAEPETEDVAEETSPEPD